VPNKKTERLLDVYEVVKLLNVHKNTVYKWSRLGLLPSIRMPGDIVRWDPKDIEKFKQQRRKG
jgi:excisionase family DNA binding protein